MPRHATRKGGQRRFAATTAAAAATPSTPAPVTHQLGDSVFVGGQVPPEIVHVLRSGLYAVHDNTSFFTPHQITTVMPFAPSVNGYICAVTHNNNTHSVDFQRIIPERTEEARRQNSRHVLKWVTRHSRFHPECHVWPMLDEEMLFESARDDDDLRLCISYWGCSAVFTNHTANKQGTFPGVIIVLSSDQDGDALVLNCRVSLSCREYDDIEARLYAPVERINVYGVTQKLPDESRYVMWRGRRVKLDMSDEDIHALPSLRTIFAPHVYRLDRTYATPELLGDIIEDNLCRETTRRAATPFRNSLALYWDWSVDDENQELKERQLFFANSHQPITGKGVLLQLDDHIDGVRENVLSTTELNARLERNYARGTRWTPFCNLEHLLLQTILRHAQRSWVESLQVLCELDTDKCIQIDLERPSLLYITSDNDPGCVLLQVDGAPVVRATLSDPRAVVFVHRHLRVQTVSGCRVRVHAVQLRPGMEGCPVYCTRLVGMQQLLTGPRQPEPFLLRDRVNMDVGASCLHIFGPSREDKNSFALHRGDGYAPQLFSLAMPLDVRVLKSSDPLLYAHPERWCIQAFTKCYRILDWRVHKEPKLPVDRRRTDDVTYLVAQVREMRETSTA